MPEGGGLEDIWDPLGGPSGGASGGPGAPGGGGGGGRGGFLASPAFSSPLLELLGRKRLYGGQAQPMQSYPGSYSPLDSGGMQSYSQAPGPSVEPSPGGGMFPGSIEANSGGGIGGTLGRGSLGQGPNQWPYANEGVLRGVFSDMIGDARGAGAFNPNGNPQIMNMIRKLFEGQGQTRERSALLGLQAQGSDPSLYGYASLMSHLGAQSDLSRQLGGAQMSEMQRANDFWRQILAQRFGQLYQPKPKEGGFDFGALMGGVGGLAGALIP